MDTSLAYIPVDRQHAMAAGVDLPDRARGTALFADISGFTPLTELLAKELGPRRGAEELARQLGDVYSALIAEVDRYRGSVIGFAGDAITCWFDGDSGARAVSSALAMQRVMRQFAEVKSPSGASVPLAVKVALASGDARRFRVGNPRVQYIDTLAGATLERMAAAEHHAEKGEVVASEEVVRNPGDGLAVREWRTDEEEASGYRFAVLAEQELPAAEDPWPPLPGGTLPDDLTREWLLPTVYERLRSGQGEFLSELRPVTALFLRFTGIDYDRDPEAGTRLDAYVRWVQGVLSKYEATLIQLTIGDKGTYLYAAFGAPIAHDDDPDRAVAAALELRAVPPEVDFIRPVQIGISRGRMRVGAYGSPACRTYGALGDDTNLAARLMSRAEPGQIIASRQIVDSASRHFDFTEIGLVTVKGKKEPILISEVAGRKGARSQGSTTVFSGRLIGRDAELAQMSGLLNMTLQGAGQILRLQGPAGVGKSHLAAALTAMAVEQGARVASGACQSTTVGTAYAPWRQVFQDLLELNRDAPESQDPDQATARQVAALEAYMTQTNPGWLLRLPLLGDLLGLPIPDNATTAAFEPRLRQAALFDLVGEMVQNWAAAQPLVVLLDDVHWMDQASQGLTVSLGRLVGGLRVMLALIQRPLVQGDASLAELNDLAYHQVLDLGELSPEGVAALITARLGGEVSPLALSLIQMQTEGNPFFVEEVLDSLLEANSLICLDNGTWALSTGMTNSLLEAGCLTRQGSEWVLEAKATLSAADLGLPDSIQGVVLSRIDRLPEAHKLTLKVASVIGYIFALDLLGRTHPLRLSGEDLGEQATTLEARDFTRLETPPPHPAYMFKHNVTHDVAYEMLLYAQRSQLHRAVGEALESVSPDEIGELAYHTFAGEDWARAIRYQALAGQRAQRLFANHESIEHFKKALYCAERLPADETVQQRLQTNAALGELFTNTGQYEPGLDHLQKALDLSVEVADPDAQARVCRWIARLYEMRGDYPASQEWIQRGLEALGDKETSAKAEMLAIAGLINTRRGNYDEARGQSESSLRLAEKLSETASLAFAYSLRGMTAIRQGNNLAAIDDYENAARFYAEVGNVGGEGISHNLIANAYFNVGKWVEADSHYREARRIFNQTGDVYNLVFLENNLGGISLNRGRLDEALQLYSHALEMQEQIGGSVYVMGALHMNLGATYVRRDEPAKAIEHLEIGQRLFEEANARDFLPECYRHFAEAALLENRLPDAERYARQALDVARELTIRSEEGCSLRVLGEVTAAEGHLDQANEYLDESLRMLTEISEEYESARSSLSLARVQALRGEGEQARRQVASSAEIFQRLDAALDLEAANALATALENAGS